MTDHPDTVVSQPGDATWPYPMWVVSCPDDGFVCTVWEKPGTGCSYFEYCPDCGNNRIETTKVTDGDNHRATVDRVDAQAYEESA